MRWQLWLAAGLAAWPAAGNADGKQIFLHGNGNGAMPCAACHGLDGGGKPAIGAPALAGRPAAVLRAQLERFAKGEGGSALMQRIAAALSPAETRAVTAFLASLQK